MFHNRKYYIFDGKYSTKKRFMPYIEDINRQYIFYPNIIYSTFANVEVKEFKEVREVKAICFIAKYTTKKAIGYNF